MQISIEAKKNFFYLIRETIEKKLFGKSKYSVELSEPIFDEKLGAFITIKIRKRLRGCIGTVLSDEPLRKTIPNLAISSAFKDPRFDSLSKEEYLKINIEISLLSSPRKISNYNEIKVGEHGLIISKGHKKGLLLPQVATEHKWDKETFLSHTCQKANLPKDEWKNNSDLQIEVFEAIIFNESEI
jgi:AmmeMemoRadiSam system protein A